MDEIENKGMNEHLTVSTMVIQNQSLSVVQLKVAIYSEITHNTLMQWEHHVEFLNVKPGST
jgi:hypothetical protein